MTASRPLLSFAFVLLAALPSQAQQLAPVALRDTFPTLRREISPVGTIIGGTVGAALGTFVGVLAGSALSEGCHGEECQLGPVLLGGLVGESLGLALGAHAGSRSTVHSHIVTTALTSAGIVVGGVLIGVGMNRAGGVMVPLTPAFQLAAALAIESR